MSSDRARSSGLQTQPLTNQRLCTALQDLESLRGSQLLSGVLQGVAELTAQRRAGRGTGAGASGSSAARSSGTVSRASQSASGRNAGTTGGSGRSGASGQSGSHRLEESRRRRAGSASTEVFETATRPRAT